MKKITLLLLVSVLVFTGVNAQGLSLGLKGGANISYINGYEEIAGDDVRISYLFGGYLEIPVSDHLSIQPEVLYSSQGTAYEDTEDDLVQYTDDEFILDYVIVPVLLKFYPGKRFSIQAGPQVGFLLSAKNKYKENGTQVEDDYKEFLSNTDFGLAIGFGYKMDFGLNIDARYVHGLADINDMQMGEEIKNQVFQVSVGYSFLK